jgi:ADP-dependent NAD(P)H-hydrate dehydratase / NAD(P)H-hydrate epimerase
MNNLQPIEKDLMQAFKWPENNSHKHLRGRVAVFSGDELHTGAARLAARAAQRMGAGWVEIFAQADAARIIASHETSIMVHKYRADNFNLQELDGFDCIIIGMAYGQEIMQKTILQMLLSHDIPIILDADAINIIANNRKEFVGLLHSRKNPTIITPHDGEFARLYGGEPPKEINERANAAFEMSRELNAIIALKGAKTIIADYSSNCGYINNISSPWLATAGSGDVLAGFIGALLAQIKNPAISAALGVFLHSQCAIKIGAGLIAEDIPNKIGEILHGFAPDNLK